MKVSEKLSPAQELAIIIFRDWTLKGVPGSSKLKIQGFCERTLQLPRNKAVQVAGEFSGGE